MAMKGITGPVTMPPFARRLAESLMTDTVTWTRVVPVSGPIVIDPTTGQPTVTTATTVFSGPARFFLQRIPRRTGGGLDAGDYVVTMTTYCSIPYTAPNLAVADVGTISGSLEHPQDIGQTYRVVGVIRNTQASAQRFQVEAIVG
jgi:hypothetical protein